jgi:carboxymethylenebutenolidase
MRVRTETVDLPRDGGVMRVFVARPDDDRRYPALAFYSDIFQMTESTQRMAIRFASYGYIVAAPEISSRPEPRSRSTIRAATAGWTTRSAPAFGTSTTISPS